MQKLALLAGGTVLGVLLLAALEGLLAVAGMGSDRGDPLAGFSPAQRLFEVQERAGEEWLVTRPSRLLWFNEQRFPRHQAPGALRVITLGGSTTFGRPYDDAVSFSSWLRLLLDEAEPGGRHEVINAGGISYASYRIDVLLGELLAYEPDVLVVYTGHNEFLEERTWPALRGGPGGLRRVQDRLSRLRTAALLRQALGGEGEKPDPLAERGLDDDVRARLDVQDGLEAYHRDDALRQRVVAEFRGNLERIVTRARDAGVGVVLVKPASNLKDFPPFKSEPAAGLGPEARDRFERLLADGRSQLENGATEATVDSLREAASLDPRHAEARFLLGRAELAMGRPEAARLELEAAREEDVCPLRAPAALVEAVAELGAALDVPLIDLPELLEDESRRQGGHGLLGNDQFLDHVHPTIPVHQRLAVEIHRALVDSGLLDGSAVPGARREELFAKHLAGFDGAYFARRDVNLGKVLGWAGQIKEAQRAFERALTALPDDPEAHFYLGMGLEQDGRPAEAAEHYRRAAELAPDHFRARFNLGKALQAAGDAEGALEALQGALARQPGDARTLYELARTLGALDRIPEAREALEGARKADPSLEGLDETSAALERRAQEARSRGASARRRVDESPADPGAHNALGEALGRARDLDGAEAAFREAIRLDPAFAPAHRNLGAVLQIRGDLAAAEAAFARVTEIEPDEARGHLELGVVRRARGDLRGAVSAFRRAVELDPGLGRAWNNLGAALVASGDGAGALAAFEQAVRTAPDSGDAHFNLAGLLWSAGRRAEARRHYLRARELGVVVPEDRLGNTSPPDR